MSKPRRGRAKARTITDFQWAFLNDDAAGIATGKKWERYEMEWNRTLGLNEPITAQLWREYSAEILARWIAERPGTRPSLWWKFEAPRAPRGSLRGMLVGDDLPQPRLQVGGSGRPANEVLAYCPRMSFGVPTTWADVEPGNPPLVESEAAYLERMGLLTAAERDRLNPFAFLPAAVDG